MFIRFLKKSDIKEADLTPEKIYNARREIIKKLAFVPLSFPAVTQAGIFDFFGSEKNEEKDPLFKRASLHSSKVNEGLSLPLTPEKKILTYNNFYEFGTKKTDPEKYSQSFIVDPWKLEVTGLVNKPITLTYDDLLKRFPLEERNYRMRCVEAWSMNIPWIGFSLARLLKAADPLSRAKYVAFETLFSPKQMPGQDSNFGGGIDFPYIEGLRMDEAMHPLTLLSVGLYGKTLAPQNGAPIRLVVPWKYGFKSIKSIVKIHLLESQPKTTWNLLGPKEYGFYANVNPKVDHPRWSQATERFITEGNLFSTLRQNTLPFNGYEEDVASLYQGMNLKENY